MDLHRARSWSLAAAGLVLLASAACEMQSPSASPFSKLEADPAAAASLQRAAAVPAAPVASRSVPAAAAAPATALAGPVQQAMVRSNQEAPAFDGILDLPEVLALARQMEAESAQASEAAIPDDATQLQPQAQ